MPKPTTNATYSSDYYYGLYQECLNNEAKYKKELEEIDSKKERYFEEARHANRLKVNVKSVIEEIKTLEGYLEYVSVDGTSFDKGMCYTNKKTLTEIYNFADKLYKDLQNEYEKNQMLVIEYRTKTIPNNISNKYHYYGLYKDIKEKEELIKEKEELAAKSGRSGPTRGTK